MDHYDVRIIGYLFRPHIPDGGILKRPCTTFGRLWRAEDIDVAVFAIRERDRERDGRVLKILDIPPDKVVLSLAVRGIRGTVWKFLDERVVQKQVVVTGDHDLMPVRQGLQPV